MPEKDNRRKNINRCQLQENRLERVGMALRKIVYPQSIDGIKGYVNLTRIVGEQVADLARREVVRCMTRQSKDLGQDDLGPSSWSFVAHHSHLTIDQAFVGKAHLHAIDLNGVVELRRTLSID